MIRFFDSRGDYTLKNGNVRALLGDPCPSFSTRGVGHAGSSYLAFGLLGALGVKVVEERHTACFMLAI